jgi:mRNA interferase MazF
MASAEGPSRGEIWLVSLGAARKGEPGKNRPAIVISADEILAGTDDESIVVVPLSSSRAPSKLRPSVSPMTGIDAENAAIPRAIRAVSRRRLLRRLDRLEPDTLAAVDRALATVLALDSPASCRVGSRARR